MAFSEGPRWKQHLTKELVHASAFQRLDDDELLREMEGKELLSRNYDTAVALDWPHYCRQATVLCGGPKGWCYTFSGHQSNAAHGKKVALNDVLARRVPESFAEQVTREVARAVEQAKIPYPNLRISGSGEITKAHVPALVAVARHGVHLWGFTRDLSLAGMLRNAGANMLISCDASSQGDLAALAIRRGFQLAYTSRSIDDLPPEGTLVTFPLHKQGRVAEVVDTDSVCPKVLEEFLEGGRRSSYCQSICHRCHGSSKCV
jgi:hypothetical protein